MKTLIFNGPIRWGGEFGSITINDDILVCRLEDYDGQIGKVTYFISNEPIEETTVEEKFLASYYQGLTNLNNEYISGTSWTGVYSQHDVFSIGGHDINQELSDHIGKYCLLKFEVIENTTDVRED